MTDHHHDHSHAGHSHAPASYGRAFAIGTVLIGVWPKPLTDLMEPAIAQLATQLATSKL